MTTLLDANVLIALVVSDHVHHDAAEDWFAQLAEPFATCPVTQGSLLRLLIRKGWNAEDARAVIVALSAGPHHQFWPDNVSFADFELQGVIGHRQVTDSYLAQLTRANRGSLATFDHGLAAAHPDITQLLPTTA